jgi:hypothetical protein
VSRLGFTGVYLFEIWVFSLIFVFSIFRIGHDGSVVDAIEDVLEREDLTLQQRREIAERIDRVTSGLKIGVDLNVEVFVEK